ncbi:unnamed protein product [Rhizoctonia solani]|uniref:Protein kinase domain-containing protein n=1 Tax=Rhizoctonia solani TaxID=456999 RepID=A0A8H3CC66_9AGAM|nr:unnamed protein product [Rhizoctonia solani]
MASPHNKLQSLPEPKIPTDDPPLNNPSTWPQSEGGRLASGFDLMHENEFLETDAYDPDFDRSPLSTQSVSHSSPYFANAEDFLGANLFGGSNSPAFFVQPPTRNNTILSPPLDSFEALRYQYQKGFSPESYVRDEPNDLLFGHRSRTHSRASSISSSDTQCLSTSQFGTGTSASSNLLPSEVSEVSSLVSPPSLGLIPATPVTSPINRPKLGFQEILRGQMAQRRAASPLISGSQPSGNGSGSQATAPPTVPGPYHSPHASPRALPNKDGTPILAPPPLGPSLPPLTVPGEHNYGSSYGRHIHKPGSGADTSSWSDLPPPYSLTPSHWGSETSSHAHSTRAMLLPSPDASDVKDTSIPSRSTRVENYMECTSCKMREIKCTGILGGGTSCYECARLRLYCSLATGSGRQKRSRGLGRGRLKPAIEKSGNSEYSAQSYRGQPQDDKGKGKDRAPEPDDSGWGSGQHADQPLMPAEGASGAGTIDEYVTRLSNILIDEENSNQSILTQTSSSVGRTPQPLRDPPTAIDSPFLTIECGLCGARVFAVTWDLYGNLFGQGFSSRHLEASQPDILFSVPKLISYPSVINEGSYETRELPAVYISKALRVSARDFDDLPTVDGGNLETQGYSGEHSWRSFVKAYRNRVSQWANVRHRNVVRIYDYNIHSLNLHVEYCSRGSVREYIKARPDGMLSKREIIFAVLRGVRHLHNCDPPIIHGGLNAGKVFVDENHKVKIGEFGLAGLCYQTAPFFPSVSFSGFSRWMSPELLDVDPDGDSMVEPTMRSDIWALGCTIHEIVLEELPYSKYMHDIKIQRVILDGELPGNPTALTGKEIGLDVRNLVISCWSKRPTDRPTAGILALFDPNRPAPISDTLDAKLVELGWGEGVEIYNSVSTSPIDPVPPMRELYPNLPPHSPSMYTNPNTSGFAERERVYAPVPEHHSYPNPNSTFSPPFKSASPALDTSSSHYHPTNNPSPGPYINPNRLNDIKDAQSPYSKSSQGATPSMGSMPSVRGIDFAEVLNDPHGPEELARKGLDTVDSFMEILRQDVATGHPDSHRYREALIALWKMTGHYPAERDITDEISRVGKTPIERDAVSFTHTGIWLGIQPVAIRYLRAVASPGWVRRRLRRDIDTWQALFHPNIHTFISCVTPRHGAFGLVMPIAEQGNVIQYLSANPGADRTKIVIQAAEGLRYLHDEAKLVHGDFRGVNLLVSNDGRVMLTGYGILTTIEKNQELGFPQWGLHWGDVKWMAPELHHYLNPKTNFPGQRSTQSDVYAFACTALEIWTSAAPFAGQSDANVIFEVANKGRHPPRPQNVIFISKSRTDQVWGLLQACWNLVPRARPSIRTVLENLQVLAE